jgi:hypothetical protein
MKKMSRSNLSLALVGVFLTLLIAILGAPFLRVLWTRFGSVAYWLTGLALTPAFALSGGYVAASVWVLIGLFSELEARGIRWVWNSILSLVVSFVVLGSGAFYELHSKGITTYSQFAESSKSFVETSTPVGHPLRENLDALLQILPALAFMILILILAHGLVFEGWVCGLFRIPRERFAGQIRFLEFKLPDVMVWVGMISFLGSFLDWPGKVVSTNIVYVCGLLFFLQGMAILESFFIVLRTGWFVRGISRILFILQSLVLVLVGFMDFWIDFRGRFRKLGSKAQTTGM